MALSECHSDILQRIQITAKGKCVQAIRQVSAQQRTNRTVTVSLAVDSYRPPLPCSQMERPTEADQSLCQGKETVALEHVDARTGVLQRMAYHRTRKIVDLHVRI